MNKRSTGSDAARGNSAWPLRALLTGIVVASVTACGGGSGTSGPKDTTPPEIKPPLIATLGVKTLDLSKSDARQVITAPTALTLKVVATDDTTPTDALKVQALDDSDSPIAGQTAKFHNGLWEVTTTADSGLTLHVGATDNAGNQTIWPYAAVFPTKAQAVVGTWTLLIYDNTASSAGVYPVKARPHDTLTANTWCQDDDEAGNGPQGGTWAAESDGRLKLETRTNTACASADFSSPVQSTRVSDFYVDATYFSVAPYTHQGGAPAAGDYTGTWSYKVDLTTGGQTKTLTPSLVLNSDKTFTWTKEDGHTLAGTYDIRPNPNYSASFGQLFVLTVDKQDGASITPVVAVHYIKVTPDSELLVDPFVQVS